MNEQILARQTFMQIEHARPPNFEEIARVFPAAHEVGVIFTYGDILFNPSGRPLSNALLRHEEVHAHQQALVGVEAWWAQYLIDPLFRFGQESAAHIAEWKAVLEGDNNRANRRKLFATIAKRLSGPLYGRLATYDDVKLMLKKAGMQEIV